MSLLVARQTVRVAENIVESGVADFSKIVLVQRDSVIVEDGDSDNGEQRQRDEMGMAREEGGDCRRGRF